MGVVAEDLHAAEPIPLSRTDADELTELRIRVALALRRVRARLRQLPADTFRPERAVLRTIEAALESRCGRLRP